MLNLLFVCMGNICRSPLAEGTFQYLVEQRGLSTQIFCDSAGTHRYHLGALPDARTRRNAEAHGLTLTHRCRLLTGEDFARFDYLVAMDRLNLTYLQQISHGALGIQQPDSKTFLLRRFDPLATAEEVDVPDPYSGEESDFEEVYQIVRRSNERLLDFLTETHSLRVTPQTFSEPPESRFL